MQVADAGGEQLAAQLGDEGLANVTDSVIVVLDGLESVHPLLGNPAVHVLGATEEAGVGGNGHDAGENGDGDATLADTADPADEVVGVVEHLGDDEGGAHVDLLLEVVEELILVLVVIAALGVASDANVEVVSVRLSDVLDEIAGILEASLGDGPLALVTGRVASQGQDVGAAGLVSTLESVVDLFGVHVGAGQMHAGLKTVDGLGLDDHLAGQLGSLATGTPGDVDELGTKVIHAVHSLVQVLDTLGGLGREVLEGEGRLAGPLGVGEHVFDVHVGRGSGLGGSRELQVDGKRKGQRAGGSPIYQQREH